MLPVALSLFASVALASPVEFFGFGARKMGRAGEGVALRDGTDSILSNPAAIAGASDPELSLGVLGTSVAFTPIQPLWWDTNRDARIDASDTPLDIGPAYDPIGGLLLGTTHPVTDTLTVGAALFLPRRLVRLSTFDPQVPTYFLYANRAQRYELGLAAGWRPFAGLAIGVGAQVLPRAEYSLEATLDLTVEGGSADSTTSDVVGVRMDVHRMQLDLVSGLVPAAGVHWDVGEAAPALEGLELGGSWRGEGGLPVDVDIDLQINAGTQDVGDLEDLRLPFLLAVQLGVFDHYVPSQWTVGAAYTFSDTLTVSGDVRRTAWDGMLVSIAHVGSSTLRGAAADLGENPVVDGNPLDLTLRATTAPRLGVDLRLPGWQTARVGRVRPVVRGGFGWEPSPLVSQGADSALLDASRTLFAMGAGVEHGSFVDSGMDMRWDAFFQYHALSSDTLVRPDPGVPTAGYAVDGKPLPVGGHLLAAGLQWSTTYR